MSDSGLDEDDSLKTHVSDQDVQEDVQNEIDAMIDLEIDKLDQLDINTTLLSESLDSASTQVVVQNTLDEYRRCVVAGLYLQNYDLPWLLLTL